VFSEVIPVELLADISGQLRVSIRTGGLMVVVPAVAAAVAAPLLALCSARLERRRVLVGLSALVLVSDVIAGLAPGIGVMLAARAVQEKRPANTLKSAVRGHTEAAARKELPCPTRL
jgi:predicted MFS family arabinose efflux permease